METSYSKSNNLFLLFLLFPLIIFSQNKFSSKVSKDPKELKISTNNSIVNHVEQESINVPDQRSCGIDKHEQELQNNPEYAASFYKRQAIFKQKVAEIHQQKLNGTYKQLATLYIPVAVHFPDADESDRPCLEAYAQTQIDVINEDYTATNPDLSQWTAASAFYPGLNPGSVDVEFCIATLDHPATGDPEVVNGAPLVTIGANGSNFGSFPETDSRYAGYMNFIIKDIGSGLLGYSPLGGSIAAGNAVVMNTICYGTGAGCPSSGVVPQAPFNLGRTVTHELGHFYNLQHTFIVDGGTSCAPADGDGIADTPKVAGSTYNCPSNGSVPGCETGENSLTMNYMDYVNDACMYMFTPGQATVVEAYFATVAGDWKENVVECDAPPTPVISYASSTQVINEGTDCSSTDYTITLNIEKDPSQNADVTITTAGTATLNTDFEIIGGSLTFPTGTMASKTFTLRLFNDGIVEGDETLTLGMSLNANGGDATISAFANKENMITIIDNDVVPNPLTTNLIQSYDFEAGGADGGLSVIDEDGDGESFIFITGSFGGLTGRWIGNIVDPAVIGGTGALRDPDDYLIFDPITIPANAQNVELTFEVGTTAGSGERYGVYFSSDTSTAAAILAGTIIEERISIGGTTETHMVSSAAIAGQTGSFVLRHFGQISDALLMFDALRVNVETPTNVQTSSNTGTAELMILNDTGIAGADDSGSGNIMATIQNNNAFDYGCTNISVSRAGTSGQPYSGSVSPNLVTDKVFTITTDNTTTSGDLTSTFYFTEAEIAGWEAVATIYTRADLQIIREVGGTIVESIAATIGTFGSEVTLSAAFTGLEGVYYFGPASVLNVNKVDFTVFNIYPNPSNGNVSISLSSVDDVQVSLYDIRGRLISSEKHVNNSGTFSKELNFGTVSSGVYLLKVNSGDKTATKKLIIQ